jgi:hypothetical protein
MHGVAHLDGEFVGLYLYDETYQTANKTETETEN